MHWHLRGVTTICFDEWEHSSLTKCKKKTEILMLEVCGSALKLLAEHSSHPLIWFPNLLRDFSFIYV